MSEYVDHPLIGRCRYVSGNEPAPPRVVVSAADEWRSRIAALMARGLSRARASSRLAASDPGLRERFVQEANENAGRR